MKKTSKILMTGMLASIMFINYSHGYTAKVNVEATRIRNEMNTSSKIINVIYENDEVEVLEEDGQWCKIKHENDTGYVKKEFLEKVESNKKSENNTIKNSIVPNNDIKKEENSVNTTSNITNSVNNSNSINSNTIENNIADNNNLENSETKEVEFIKDTNLRLLPSFMSKEVQSVVKGKKYKKVTQINHWIKVSNGEIEGWVLENNVNFENTNNSENDNPDKNPKDNDVKNVVNNQVVNQVNNNVNNQVDNQVKNQINNEAKDNNITQNSTSNNTGNTTLTNTSSNKETTNEKAKDKTKTGKINVETAKIREKATTESKNTGLLDYGDKVTILEEEGDFYKITYEDKSGYVSKKLITVNK